MTRQQTKATSFAALHSGKPFVMPNPWDAGSARVLAAYGAYVGVLGSDSGYYVTTVVDLSTDATVSTLRDFAPEEWLADDRLVASENDFPAGATWLLSSGFTSPNKISPDPPVGALA